MTSQNVRKVELNQSRTKVRRCMETGGGHSLAFQSHELPFRKEAQMTFSIYQASVPVYRRRLEALSAILDKASAYASQRKIDPAVLIQARLYPDMLPLARQVQIACSHAGAMAMTKRPSA